MNEPFYMNICHLSKHKLEIYFEDEREKAKHTKKNEREEKLKC